MFLPGSKIQDFLHEWSQSTLRLRPPPTAYLPRCHGHFAAEMSSMRSIDTLRRKLDAVRAPRLPFTAPGADFLLGVR